MRVKPVFATAIVINQKAPILIELANKVYEGMTNIDWSVIALQVKLNEMNMKERGRAEV